MNAGKFIFQVDPFSQAGRFASQCNPQGQCYKSFLQKSFNVIPTKAEIQALRDFLDPGFRQGEVFIEFCKSLVREHLSYGLNGCFSIPH
jgi:hypothetical protein